MADVARTRVLVIAHNCVLASSQERLVELARHEDLEVTLLVPPRNLESHGMVELEKTSDPNYEIVRGRPLFSALAGQRYAQFYPFLSSLLARVRPRAVDLHEEPWSFTSFHATLLRNLFFKGCRIIVETEQNIYKKFPFPFSAFEKYVLKHADVVVARNEEAKRVILRKGFKGIVSILPNGLDTKVFRPVDAVAERQRLGLKNFTAGYMGRMEKEKGLDDFLRAIAMTGRNIDALMVGEGKHLAELRALGESLALKGRVVWREPVAQSRVPLFLSCMDVLVLPSRTTPTWKEQFGRALVEAMACGVPVIGSDSGAIPEVIADAGIVFREGDVEGLRGAIEMMMDDGEARGRFVRRGLELVDEKYSWARVADGLYELITAADAGDKS